MVRSAQQNRRSFNSKNKKLRTYEKRERSHPVSEDEFQVTDTHVIVFVTALLTLAYFAGLLPDP